MFNELRICWWTFTRLLIYVTPYSKELWSEQNHALQISKLLYGVSSWALTHAVYLMFKQAAMD